MNVFAENFKKHKKTYNFLCCMQLSFKTALLLERYEKRGLAGGDIQLGEEALKRRPTFGKTEDAAFRQVFNHLLICSGSLSRCTDLSCWDPDPAVLITEIS